MPAFSFPFRLLTASAFTALVGLAACDKAQEVKPETIKTHANSTADILHATDGSFIKLKTAVTMTSQFQAAHPTMNKGQYFGRDLVLELLQQSDVVGIRIYSAEKEGENQFVLVGATADNTDQFNRSIVASGPDCPNCCAPSSPLLEGYTGTGTYALGPTDGSNITLDEAKQLTERFRSNHPEMNKGQFFGKAQLQQVLAQENCTGLRIYNAEENGELQFVLVGATQANYDQFGGLLLASGPRCPNCCAVDSPLNE